jgi:hypothetical protein
MLQKILLFPFRMKMQKFVYNDRQMFAKAANEPTTLNNM